MSITAFIDETLEFSVCWRAPQESIEEVVPVKEMAIIIQGYSVEYDLVKFEDYLYRRLVYYDHDPRNGVIDRYGMRLMDRILLPLFQGHENWVVREWMAENITSHVKFGPCFLGYSTRRHCTCERSRFRNHSFHGFWGQASVAFSDPM